MPGVRVTVVDADGDRLAEAAANYTAAELASDLDDVLGRLAGVVIATPPGSHANIALQAIEAGQHVLVEKPLTTSVEDARTVVARARARGVHLMVGHTFEYNSAVWKLREIVRSGALR